MDDDYEKIVEVISVWMVTILEIQMMEFVTTLPK